MSAAALRAKQPGQPASTTSHSPDGKFVAHVVQQGLASPGQPLEDELRAWLEPHFGHDFSRVRIHRDQAAEESARQLAARAYAVGRDVVFAAGQYAPRTGPGKELLAHELAHTLQQARALPGLPSALPLASANSTFELQAARAARDVSQGRAATGLSLSGAPLSVARSPDADREAALSARRQAVDMAAQWLNGLAQRVEALRQIASVDRATTPGSAAGPRAYHARLNQTLLSQQLESTISTFEAQRSDNPLVNFPAESPEQTHLGEAYARALQQIGLALEEAHANAASLAPSVQEEEERRYASNHVRWLGANPSAPLQAGIRTTFTPTERRLSGERARQTSAELADLPRSLHNYNLAGSGAERLRSAISNAQYRLVEDPTTGQASPQRDTSQDATLRPILDQLGGIQWGINQAIGRLEQAERRTRAFASDPTADAAVGSALQTHFSTRDPGYATLLADRFARMRRELAGQGALFVHAPDPADTECSVGSVGGGLSQVDAHARPNHFFFCSGITVGDEHGVSTIIHETVHAVIPSLGATASLTAASDTPRDRAYAYERIYSRMSTEEALDNAESYSFYVDQLLGIRVSRPEAPQDVITGCSDEEAVRNAIARATYRIRLGAMWADQTMGSLGGGAPPADILEIIHHGFPTADAARAREILTHLRYLAGTLEYYLPVTCRPASDPEARAGALAYGPANAATAGGMRATTRSYPGDTLRLCPGWFPADVATREDALTAVLVLRYRSQVPPADVMGFVSLMRFIQEEAHPSLAGRSLQQHQAADRPAPPGP